MFRANPLHKFSVEDLRSLYQTQSFTLPLKPHSNLKMKCLIESCLDLNPKLRPRFFSIIEALESLN